MRKVLCVEIEQKKLRRWILLILVLLIPISTALVALRITQAVSREREMDRLKMGMVSELLSNAEKRNSLVKKWFLDNIDVNMQLMRDCLKEFLTEDGYNGPRVFEDGIVIEVRGETIIYPDDMPDNCPDITLPILLKSMNPKTNLDTVVSLSGENNPASDEGSDDSQVSLRSTRIGNGFYYVDWTSLKEYEEYTNLYAETDNLLAAVEKSLNIGILVVDPQSEDLKLLSSSGIFPRVSSAAELGISREDLDKDGRLIRIDGKLYQCAYQELPQLGKNLLYLSPFTITVLRSIGTPMMIVAVILLLLVTIGAWILSVRLYVRHKNISKDPEKIELYRPRRMRVRAYAASMTGVVIVFLFALIFQSLSAMQYETENARQTINVLFNQLQESERQQLKKSEELEADWFVYYGERLATLISENPVFGTREYLEYYCTLTGSDYIMLFDTQGQETISSGNYIGLQLDSCFGENSGDFLKLLNGIPSIVHKPAVDNLTGETSQLVGVCLPQYGGYGALVMSVYTDWTQRVNLDEDLNTWLAIMTPEGRQCFAAEAEGGLIRYASSESMIDSTVEECGLPAETLRDSYTDFVTLNNVRSYAVTTEMEPLICYCSTDTRYLFSRIWGYAFASALAAAIALLVMVRFLLKDYTPERFEEWFMIEQPVPSASAAESAMQGQRRSLLFYPRMARDKFWAAVKKSLQWEEADPEGRTGIVFRIMLFLLILICAFYAMRISRITTSEQSILLFILNGKWMRGFNLFALCSILILCGSAYLFMAVLRYFLKLISSFAGRRGETICRLIRSILQYAALIAVVYFSLSYLGFSPGTIMASVGVTALVVTLGARDMFTDMFAGIFIVLEDQFQVGDIVSIEDYRGVVQEIGIRSVKLLGFGGDIRIFSNSTIRNVTNKSRYLSTCIVDLRVSSRESIAKVKEIMTRELPEIGARCGNIIGAPRFIGVTTFPGLPGIAFVGVEARCKEEDFLDVRQKLRSELVQLCEREHIDMA